MQQRQHRLRRPLRALALLGCLCAALLPAAPARAQTDGPDTFRVRALGDSIASGFGVGDNALKIARCAGSLPTGRCDHLGRSWPVRFASALSDSDTDGLPVDFASQAVGGATSADFDGGRFDARVQSIVDDDPDVILISLGANDVLTRNVLGLRSFALDCVLRPGCPAKRARSTHLASHLRHLLARLVDNTGADIVISRYYKVSQDYAGLVGAVNDAIVAAAKPFRDDGVLIVSPPSFRGHGCGRHTRNSWMLRFTQDTCIHPNNKGIARIADAALRAWRDDVGA